MKANLKNILGLVALGMALLATTGPTWAGRTITAEVRHLFQPILPLRIRKPDECTLQCG